MNRGRQSRVYFSPSQPKGSNNKEIKIKKTKDRESLPAIISYLFEFLPLKINCTETTKF